MESMMAAGTSRGRPLSWMANENLKATTGNAYEIGGRYKSELGENSSVSLTAKYFRTEYKNLIVDNNAAGGIVGCPGGAANTLCRANAGGADIDGVELFARLILDDLSLAAGYTHNSKNVASANSDKKTKVPSYAVHDLYVTYAPDSGQFKGLEINAGVYNLFDKAYASHSQRSADFTGDSNAIDWEPGRNFKLSVAYKF